MAMTHDYMDYLNEKVGISPAGSQEELQAANTIADLMRQHDVEPNIEEFDAKTFGGVVPSVLYVLTFVGIFVGGIGIGALTAVGFVLVAVPCALFVLKYLGRDFISGLGPTTRSQNVVSYHEATGPMVIKGNRPIVIVAHYDSPHENVLMSTPLAPYVPILWKASKYCVPAVAVCMLFQLLAFLPEPVRRLLWVVGIVAALPLAVLGVTRILEHFSSCTEGANDNKSGVASMLGVLENVRPSGLKSVHGSESIEEAVEAMHQAAQQAAEAAEAAEQRRREAAAAKKRDMRGKLGDVLPFGGGAGSSQADEGYEDYEGYEGPALTFVNDGAGMADAAQAAGVEQGPAVKVVRRRGKVEGVRHGEDVVKSLGMLPEGCEVEYVEPEPEYFEVPIEPAPQPVVPMAAPAEGRFSMSEPTGADEFEPAAGPEFDSALAEAPAEFAEAPAPVEPEATAEYAAEADDVEADQPAAATSSMNFDGLDDGTTLDPDNTGLTAEVTEADATQPTAPIGAPKPAAPDDPEWGKTSFRPSGSDPARRTTLFDLPDPGSKSMDPFATDPDAPKVSSGMGGAANTAQMPAQAGEAPQVQDFAPGDQQPIESRFQTISAVDDAEFEVIDEDDEPAQTSVDQIIGRVKGFFSKLGSKVSSGADRAGADDAANEYGDEGDSYGDDADDSGTWQGGWKGGATTRSGLRVVEGEGSGDVDPADVPTEEDMREQILGLGDDALISHDIWFVALGASDCDHAGMRAFLAEHRKQIRGAFVINLDSVAAGELTLLTHEGLLTTRRADRRLNRMLSTVATDLHIPMDKRKYDWDSTDATPAMLSSMRSVTLMGTDASGVRALSRTPEDVAENLVPAQAVAVTEAVTELIRRS